MSGKDEKSSTGGTSINGDWRLAAVKNSESVASNTVKYYVPSSQDGSTTASYFTAPNGGFAASGLGKLALTGQQAKIKQLKRVQLMKAQTHQKASMMNQRQEKQDVEEQRRNAAGARQQKVGVERATRDAVVEARRREVAAEERRRFEASQESLMHRLGLGEQKKVQLINQRAVEEKEAREQKSAEVRARQDAIVSKSAQINKEMDAKVQQVQAATVASQERIARLKAEAAQENQKRILQSESERNLTLEAAEKEYANRFKYFQGKADAKVQIMQTQAEKQATIKAARIEEARIREDNHRRRLELKLHKDKVEHEEAARRVQEKQARTRAFEVQRQILMKELEGTRAEIACHEAYLKGVAETMQLSGTYVVTPDITALEQKYSSELSGCPWNPMLPHLYPS